MSTVPEQSQSKFRFTLRPLLGAVTLVCILLAIWVNWSQIVVRAPIAGEQAGTNYFGRADPIQRPTRRKVAVVEGRFTQNRRLCASLYYVDSGIIHAINGFSVGRSRDLEIWPPSLTITLWLAEEMVSTERVTSLACTGHSRGVGIGEPIKTPITVRVSKLFAGTVPVGAPCIIYVEGDRESRVERTMTIDEFATKNKGKYLVVTAQLD